MSHEDFPNLCKYLHWQSTPVKAIWIYPTNRALPLREKFAAILREHEETAASQTVSNDSTQMVGSPKGGFPTKGTQNRFLKGTALSPPRV